MGASLEAKQHAGVQTSGQGQPRSRCSIRTSDPGLRAGACRARKAASSDGHTSAQASKPGGRTHKTEPSACISTQKRSSPASWCPSREHRPSTKRRPAGQQECGRRWAALGVLPAVNAVGASTPNLCPGWLYMLLLPPPLLPPLAYVPGHTGPRSTASQLRRGPVLCQAQRGSRQWGLLLAPSRTHPTLAGASSDAAAAAAAACARLTLVFRPKARRLLLAVRDPGGQYAPRHHRPRGGADDRPHLLRRLGSAVPACQWERARGLRPSGLESRNAAPATKQREACHRGAPPPLRVPEVEGGAPPPLTTKEVPTHLHTHLQTPPANVCRRAASPRGSALPCTRSGPLGTAAASLQSPGSHAARTQLEVPPGLHRLHRRVVRRCALPDLQGSGGRPGRRAFLSLLASGSVAPSGAGDGAAPALPGAPRPLHWGPCRRQACARATWALARVRVERFNLERSQPAEGHPPAVHPQASCEVGPTFFRLVMTMKPPFFTSAGSSGAAAEAPAWPWLHFRLSGGGRDARRRARWAWVGRHAQSAQPTRPTAMTHEHAHGAKKRPSNV